MKKILFLLLFAVLGSTAHAQSYVMKFESELGFRLPALLDSATVGFRQRTDLNGDGNPELILRRLDEQDNPVEMVAVDLAAGGQEIWTLSFEDVTMALGSGAVGLMGFFNVHSDSIKDVVFRSRQALVLFPVDLTGGKHSADDPFVLPAEQAAALDLDGDGFTEIILQNPETKTVQVWGGGDMGTATEDDIGRALLHLAQSYPNPFRQSTTIAYTVEQAAPVTLTVYDLLGRRVRTLVDERQPVGAYQIEWDGRAAGGQPVAAGTYFYRLHVGEAMSSKQALRVK